MKCVLYFFKKKQYSLLLLLFLTHLCSGLNFLFSNSEAGETSGLFPEINGWKMSEDIKIYTPEILYDYINGAAELYLIYDFQELRVAEYTNKNEASIVVEIYLHKTPEYAFGIYSQERPTEGNFIDIGAQGYIAVSILNFLSGNAYVKIRSYSLEEKIQEVLQTFAEKIAANLGARKPLPKILDCFPEKGKKKNSEKFISKNFLGYEFLHSGYTTDYNDTNTIFKLFIIKGADIKDCEEMLKQYMQFTKYSRRDLKQGLHTLSDPYHGEVALSWKEKYIWGIIGLNDKKIRIEYLSQIEKKLFISN